MNNLVPTSSQTAHKVEISPVLAISEFVFKIRLAYYGGTGGFCFALIAQWIERKPPELEIVVRFHMGVLLSLL